MSFVVVFLVPMFQRDCQVMEIGFKKHYTFGWTYRKYLYTWEHRRTGDMLLKQMYSR